MAEGALAIQQGDRDAAIARITGIVDDDRLAIRHPSIRSKRDSGMPPSASRRRVDSARPDDSIQLFIALGSP